MTTVVEWSQHKRLRTSIPALSNEGPQRRLFLDAPSGTQMPRSVLSAMNGYILGGMANRGGIFPTALDTEEMLLQTRQKVRALLGLTDQHTVVFGQNMTSLAFIAAAAIRRDWNAGTDRHVVVSELDHHANIDPWLSAARDAGMGERWLEVNPRTYSLDLSRLNDIVDENCALVAVGLSSNAIGTASDINRIVRRAREVGAISVIDAVHGLSHIPLDVDALGADIVFLSAYKMFGPHIGVMAIRDEVLDRIRFNKLSPAPTTGSGKAELGTQNMEAIAGLSATIDFVASFGDDGATSLRSRLLSAVANFARYEDGLAESFVRQLSDVQGVRLARAPDHVAKTSTVAFTVDGVSPEAIARRCAAEGVYLTHGMFYAHTLARRLQVAETGGWVRVGIAPYHDAEDLSVTINALRHAIAAESTS